MNNVCYNGRAVSFDTAKTAKDDRSFLVSAVLPAWAFSVSNVADARNK
jgi:hypothetical protein